VTYSPSAQISTIHVLVKVGTSGELGMTMITRCKVDLFLFQEQMPTAAAEQVGPDTDRGYAPLAPPDAAVAGVQAAGVVKVAR